MSGSTSDPSCAISKSMIKKQGLYTYLPTPSQPWESISMDYLSGLPSTRRKIPKGAGRRDQVQGHRPSMFNMKEAKEKGLDSILC